VFLSCAGEIWRRRNSEALRLDGALLWDETGQGRAGKDRSKQEVQNSVLQVPDLAMKLNFLRILGTGMERPAPRGQCKNQ
jgi:hypothetical protein